MRRLTHVMLPMEVSFMNPLRSISGTIISGFVLAILISIIL